MPALEDPLVPWACAKLLTAIYAQAWLDCRYGYCPGRGAHDAVRDRTCALQYGQDGSLVEADVQGFFDHMDHWWLMPMWRERMDDRACLRRMRQWLKAGMLEIEGHVVPPATGAPPGGSSSPVLANGSVHDALDGWCATVVKAHGRGEALWYRYAEDWVGALR